MVSFCIMQVYVCACIHWVLIFHQLVEFVSTWPVMRCYDMLSYAMSAIGSHDMPLGPMGRIEYDLFTKF